MACVLWILHMAFEREKSVWCPQTWLQLLPQGGRRLCAKRLSLFLGHRQML